MGANSYIFFHGNSVNIFSASESLELCVLKVTAVNHIRLY